MPNGKQSLAQFGQTIKAKHPEYADIPDEELGRKVLAKYPQYSDMVETSPTAPSTPGTRLFGNSPVSDTLNVVGSHLKNLVAGPYHAFADAPRNAEEQQIKGTSGNPGEAPNALGQFGLGMARMFVQPTREAIRTALAQHQAGNNTGQEYDAQGNYHPNAIGSAMDAIPIAGPLARQVETDAHQHGAIPALAGLAIDMMAPKAVERGIAGLHSLAPSVAEGALGISKTDRAFGKTPGRAILDETTGVRPSTIAASAQSRLNTLTPQMQAMADNHPHPVSIAPAIDSIDDASNKTMRENNVIGTNAIAPVRAQLTDNPYGLNQQFAPPTVGNPNATISPLQTASGALDLKRGLRNQFVKNSWNPDAGPVLQKEVARNASGVIDSQLDNALGPEFRNLNQRILSLIPVQEGAESVSRGAGLGQRVAGRLRAPTGALTSVVGGSAAGAASGGPLGAVVGGGMGLLAPELISSPTAQMAIARTLNSRILNAAPVAASGNLIAPFQNRNDQ